MSDVTARRATCEDLVRNPVSTVRGWPFRAGAAAVAGACAAVHLLAAASMAITAVPATAGTSVLVLLGMSLACLPCAVHVLVGPTRRTWCALGLMAAGMLVVHPLLEVLGAGHHTMAVPGPLAVGLLAGPVLGLGIAVAGVLGAPRGR